MNSASRRGGTPAKWGGRPPPRGLQVDQHIIIQNSIIAVVVVDAVEHAVPVAEALAEGGVKSIELALRTEAGINAIAAIKKQHPDILVGAGTVIFPEQVEQVIDAGADFGVAPGTAPVVMEEAAKRGLPFAPGIATPSDIEAALRFSMRVLKFYPAEPQGGTRYLSSMAGPYNYLGLRFVPLGGVTINNLKEYLQHPMVAAVGGSWLAKRELISAEAWDKIRENAQRASEIAGSLRSTPV